VSVPMKLLTDLEFDAWWQIQTQEHLASVQTYASKGHFYYQWRPLLQPGWTLDQVKQTYFP